LIDLQYEVKMSEEKDTPQNAIIHETGNEEVYEMRTYTLRLGGVPEYESRVSKLLPARQALSRPAAFFHTEVGPLNQIIQIWPFDDLHNLQEVRDIISSDDSVSWPPGAKDFAQEGGMQMDLLTPAPFMRPWLAPQKLGNIYELRIYQLIPGSRFDVIKAFGEAIPHREKYSPLAGCWTSQTGSLDRFYHLWAYEDMNERMRIRTEALKDPHWPPKLGQWLFNQENKILIPTEFSAIH
jgi:hypothetical protein